MGEPNGDALDLLAGLEYAGMGAAYADEVWALCPCCAAIAPADREACSQMLSKFDRSNLGPYEVVGGPDHEPDCRLARLLDGRGEAPPPPPVPPPVILP